MHSKPTRGNVFRSTRRQSLTPADLLMVAFHRGTAILYILLAGTRDTLARVFR